MPNRDKGGNTNTPEKPQKPDKDADYDNNSRPNSPI